MAKKQVPVDSPDTPPERFLEWVRSVENIGCVRIEARQVVAGNEGGAIVATFELVEREDGDRFDAPQVYRRLCDDAEGIGSIQTYSLGAYRDGSKTPRERLVLRVDGGGDTVSAGSEPANAAGLVAQALRHNEALMQIVVRTNAAALTTLAAQNAALVEQLEKANTERVETWDMLSQLAKQQTERDEAKHQLAMKEKQADVIRDSLKLTIPGLLQKLLPSPHVQDESLARLVETLTPEQQSSMFALLTPDQAVAMGAVLDTVLKRRAKETQKEETPQ